MPLITYKPKLDGILLYRLDSDPNIVYAYKRKIIESLWGLGMLTSTTPIFHKCAIFKI